MKKLAFALSLLAIGFQSYSQKGEWTNLSDGTFDHWHVYNHPGEPVSKKWTIDSEGAFVFDPNGSSKWDVNDIVTNKDYEDFELELEWKISKGGNSGIFYGVIEDEKLHTPYMSGPEIQVLDDVNHPDAKMGKNNNRKGGSLYDMIPSASAANPYDHWNKVTVKRKNNIITIWQNGTLAVTYPAAGEGWDAMVENSKFKGWEHFGKYAKGKIGLQDHSNIVSFKNIRIREL